KLSPSGRSETDRSSVSSPRAALTGLRPTTAVRTARSTVSSARPRGPRRGSLASTTPPPPARAPAAPGAERTLASRCGNPSPPAPLPEAERGEQDKVFSPAPLRGGRGGPAGGESLWGEGSFLCSPSPLRGGGGGEGSSPGVLREGDMFRQ